MIQIEFSVRRDVIMPLVLIVVVLFMPYRLIQAIILFFVVTRVMSLASALITARLPVAARMDSVVYATARSTFSVRYEVINRSILPAGPVHVHDSAGNFATNRQPADLVVLGSGERRQLSYTASGQERGEHEIGPMILSGSDALGYYAWERRFDVPLRVIIYPAVHRVAYPEPHGLPAGNLPVQSPLYEDPTQFRSLREYMPGDELKRVNWKASARMGTLYAMEYVPTIYFPVMIALNLSSGSYPVNERSMMAERAIETAASLIFFYVGLKQEVGLVTTGHLEDADAPQETPGTGGTYSPIRPGHGHAVSLLEDLARITMSDTAADVTVQLQRVPLPAGTRLLVVSPPLSEAQADRLVALKRRGYRLLCFITGSRSTSRDDLSVPGLQTIPVMGREDELVRE